jgi:hypothetical protein
MVYGTEEICAIVDRQRASEATLTALSDKIADLAAKVIGHVTSYFTVIVAYGKDVRRIIYIVSTNLKHESNSVNIR